MAKKLRMKIVYVTRWFSHDMGYIENCLPQAVASLGHDVHIVTSTAQVYYNYPFYHKVYGSYLGAPIVKEGKYTYKNITIHRLLFKRLKDEIVLQNLLQTLKAIQPDVVHVFEHNALDTYKIAFLRLFSSFRFYSSNHDVLSVFPLAKNWEHLSLLKKLYWKIYKQLPGRIVSRVIHKCFAVTEDAGFVATKFLGVSADKLTVSTLGVDTMLFHPVSDTKKTDLKAQLGFEKDAIVCIYTGRFTHEKNPLIVAKAIEELADQGYPFRGLFVGEGVQRPDIEKLIYCKVVDFVPYPQLPSYYQSADIGIWPGQESTSQLDAVASGLNLVLTNNIKAYTLVESQEAGDERPKIVSRFYTHFDKEDLKHTLLSLLDQQERKKLTQLGVQEITQHYSWLKIAERRIADYLQKD
jgi:glycosyltransferase involved in cell wall biosynthesis